MIFSLNYDCDIYDIVYVIFKFESQIIIWEIENHDANRNHKNSALFMSTRIQDIM